MDSPPLTSLLKGRHFQIVKDLISAGEDIFQQINSSNYLPHHCAKGNYIITICKKLLAHKYKGFFLNHTRWHIERAPLSTCIQNPPHCQTGKSYLGRNNVATRAFHTAFLIMPAVISTKDLSQLDQLKNTFFTRFNFVKTAEEMMKVNLIYQRYPDKINNKI